MKKIIRPFTAKTGNGRSYSVFIEIRIANKPDGSKVLSISGVQGPLRSGHCIGSCGQINLEYRYSDALDHVSWAPAWSRHTFEHLLDIWEKWHLNDMRPGCEHQTKWGWSEKKLDDSLPLTYSNMAMWTRPSDHPRGLLTRACPICHYRFGTKWMYEPLPQDVINFLASLPDTDIEPAWV